MKRVRPWLFNITVVSLLSISAAAVALWVRSYWVSDAIAFLGAKGEFAIQSAGGVIIIGGSNVGHRSSKLQFDHWQAGFPIWDESDTLSLLNRLGFGYRSASLTTAAMKPITTPDSIMPAVVNNWRVYVPIWIIVLCATGLSLLMLEPRRRARRRRRLNLCINCGYDLRASPERCPECGEVSAPPGATIP